MSVEPIRAVLSGRPMSTTHEPLSASDGDHHTLFGAHTPNNVDPLG
jgi:hypothetical protein